jgi:hypothetical protein
MVHLEARLVPVLTLALSLALASCGGGSGTATATLPDVNLSGQIVKGPVNGAQVCAYGVSGGIRSATPPLPYITTDTTGWLQQRRQR